MKTTLNFNNRLIQAAKIRAVEEGDTLTQLIERALRDYLQAPHDPAQPFRVTLLTKRGRPVAGVDTDNRDSLYEKMEGRS